MMQPPVYRTAAAKDTFRDGVKFQDFAGAVLNPYGITTWNYADGRYQLAFGENRQGVEFKLDKPCSRTLRLSIEIEEKRDPANPCFVPSGIFAPDNAWLYVQGNYELIFVFSKKLLRRYYRHKQPPILEWPPGSAATVRKFYLPFDKAQIMAALIVNAQTGERWPGDATMFLLGDVPIADDGNGHA